MAESKDKAPETKATKAEERTDVDAMGQDKRREVVGHSYGPSKRSQMLFFVAVGVVAFAVIGGYMAAIAAFDQPEDSYADEAPWSAADAQQVPARDPSGPCGEPGNPYPVPADSPCAQEEQTSEGEPPVPATTNQRGNEEGPGGITGSGGQASPAAGSASSDASN